MAFEGGILCFEDSSLVVDLGSCVLERSPCCLQVAVEEQWIQVARWDDVLANLRECSFGSILDLNNQWLIRVSVGSCTCARKPRERHRKSIVDAAASKVRDEVEKEKLPERGWTDNQ